MRLKNSTPGHSDRCPVRVISGHSDNEARDVRFYRRQLAMGRTRPFKEPTPVNEPPPQRSAAARPDDALGPKADIAVALSNVRFVPILLRKAAIMSIRLLAMIL